MSVLFYEMFLSFDVSFLCTACLTASLVVHV